MNKKDKQKIGLGMVAVLGTSIVGVSTALWKKKQRKKNAALYEKVANFERYRKQLGIDAQVHKGKIILSKTCSRDEKLHYTHLEVDDFDFNNHPIIVCKTKKRYFLWNTKTMTMVQDNVADFKWRIHKDSSGKDTCSLVISRGDIESCVVYNEQGDTEHYKPQMYKTL